MRHHGRGTAQKKRSPTLILPPSIPAFVFFTLKRNKISEYQKQKKEDENEPVHTLFETGLFFFCGILTVVHAMM